MSSEHRSHHTLSESSTSSSTSSRVSSPSIVAMSDFSNIATSTTASSSTTSLVIPSDSSSADGLSFNSPYTPTNDAQSINGDSCNATASQDSLEPEVDPQILEALRSKDRIYVLRLGEIMEELITEKKPRADLTAATSYQRLLLHRCSAYYRLQIDIDPISKGISAVFIAESRIPLQRLADLVPPEPTPQPAFKIMQRSPHERRVKPQSHAGSVTGEDADSSDIEPSEAGSIGGRSSATGGSSKKRMTMEEREAAYNEARSRIFMGLDEKKEKEKDVSASSSSLSLASSSSGVSSIGDFEDSPTSLATESEQSFYRQDSRRPNPSAKSSGSRSLRPSAQPFTSNGSGSSRNSRAPSPSFTYASLYEAPPSGPFESHLPVQQQQQQYPSLPYGYPYSAPTQPNPPFMPPYPYYYQLGQSSIPPSQNPSEPPMSGEMYTHPQMLYNPYIWSNPNQPPLHSAPPLQPQTSMPGGPSHPYPPFMQHPPGYSYPMPGYYTPPGDMTSPSPRSAAHLFDERSMSVPLSGPNNPLHGGAHLNNSHNNRNGLHYNSPNGNMKPRTTPLTRPAWSYGPGIGMGGATVASNSSNNGETTGPRLHSMRRQSNTSSGSSSGAYRSSSNSDDVASIASSSNSSSSRRTYTSTSSSQHPLPPRPDWAVGLKPDPTLHVTSRQHEHSLNSSRNMSPVTPPRTLNGVPNANSPRRPSQQMQQQHQQQPPVSLQSTDFPPLTSMTTPEKRPPTVGGAWTNPSRSVLMTPSLGPSNSQGTALVHHPNTVYNNNNVNIMNHGNPDLNFRTDDSIAFDRPPPRAAELYNPKVAKRLNHPHVQNPGERSSGSSSDGRLNEQIRAMSLSLSDGPTRTAVSQPSLESSCTSTTS